jgi:hypothetical protein
LLGHVARWTAASVDLVFQAARVAGGLALLLTAYNFVARFFETRRARLVVWGMYALGSGLGWLAALFGGFTSDLWVAEAIPFLTLFSNAHFGLATALLLSLLGWTVPGLAEPQADAGRLLLVLAATTALGVVLPMALLNVGLVLAGVFAWWFFACRPASFAGWRRDWGAAAVFAAAAAPWLAHAAWLTTSHPVLSQWNAQNVTPSPPLWDAAISGGAALALAVPGAIVAARRRTPRDIVVLAWLGLGALALYAPFSLQRRLSIGLWMPLAIVAGMGLRAAWPKVAPRLRPLAGAGLGIVLVMSNVLVFVATLGAIAARQPELFLTRGQAAAIEWLRANAGRALVAAPPALGLWVPARSDARVLYGHPFETVDAAAREAELEAFYGGEMPGPAFVQAHHLDDVVAEADRTALTTEPMDWGWQTVFDHDGVVIYSVH